MQTELARCLRLDDDQVDEPADISRAGLERRANALLDAAGALGRADGVYTESQLTRRIRNDDNRSPRLEETALPPDLVDYLVERRIEELIDLSRLTIRQEIVFRLHVCGLSCDDIAATLNCRFQTSAAVLLRAKRKLQATYEEGRYAGWYEVYLSEVNRPAYRRRR